MKSPGFVGRVEALATLEGHLGLVVNAATDERGRCVLVRGRRRVGKSRLAEVFVERSGLASFWFSATRGERPEAERAAFVAELAASTLPGAAGVETAAPATWNAAFRALADALDPTVPAIVVVDEIPWLLEADPAAEGALQTAWDRHLSKQPVLLLLIGSDLAMMERLGDHGRAFHQRGAEFVLPPLNPAEVGEMLGLEPADAFDAALVTGGLPLVCREWPRGATWRRYLEAAFSDPTSALIVSGERVMAAEFPTEARARDVLEVIGSGERTFSRIAGRLGGATPLAPASVNNALRLLQEKRVIAADEPLSLRPAPTERRYRVDDAFLRFWLRFVEPVLPFVERGRPDLAMARVEPGWGAWRGKAIEPIVRSALARLLPDDRFPDAVEIGGWWNRQNNPEVDLVAVDRADRPGRLAFVGSVKWRERAPFDPADLAELARVAGAVPGYAPGVPLVAVSRSGATASDLAAVWTPAELLSAWR